MWHNDTQTVRTLSSGSDQFVQICVDLYLIIISYDELTAMDFSLSSPGKKTSLRCVVLLRPERALEL